MPEFSEMWSRAKKFKAEVYVDELETLAYTTDETNWKQNAKRAGMYETLAKLQNPSKFGSRVDVSVSIDQNLQLAVNDARDRANMLENPTTFHGECQDITSQINDLEPATN